MKRLKKIMSTGILTAAILSSSVLAMASEGSYGATGAMADTELTLEEMMTYAIQDEYLAHAEYEEIIEIYGSVRPFTNIIKAEATHISLMEPLFEKYGFEIPINDAADRVVLPATLEESYAIGVEAEILNIDMYERFLSEELPDDVKAAFERLDAGSEKHLVAFERALERSTGTITSDRPSRPSRPSASQAPARGRSNSRGQRSANRGRGQRTAVCR